MARNKHDAKRDSTPILAAVRAMHADEDKRPGYDPYHGRLQRPIPIPGEFPDTAKHEAESILACYETSLTLENGK